jgi:hypothetical protein
VPVTTSTSPAVWAALILFLLKEDLSVCDGGFLAVSRLFLGFIALALAVSLLQTLRLNSTYLAACFCRRCCCCFLYCSRTLRRRREKKADEKAAAALAKAEIDAL